MPNSLPFVAPVDFSSLQGHNLLDPTSAQDFSSKNYVDTSITTKTARLIAREIRTSNMTGITAITRVVSVTAPIVNGHSYRVIANGEAYIDTSTGTSQHELRYTTNGVDPAVTDTVLDRTIINHSVAGTPDALNIQALFDATSSGTFKATVCTQRVSGTGTANIAAAATFPLKLTVEDLGTTLTNTGTVY